MHYELFLSYSRKDNVPRKPGDTRGWVTALRDEILADHRRFSTEPLRIFFDTSEIRDMDDWRHRILKGLRESRILLVCLSPDYFKSPPCLWEWEEYLKRQVHALMGHESVAPVYFVEAPDSDEQLNAAWAEAVTRRAVAPADRPQWEKRWQAWRAATLGRPNWVDLKPWFPHGTEALREAAVREKLAALGTRLWERIQRARRATDVPGNLRRLNPHFIGRTTELRQLHEHLALGAVGVVTAVHGLGGQGKTELATAYAHGWADSYPAGLWVLGAESRQELLPLLGELCAELHIPFSTEQEKQMKPEAAAASRGRRVLAELKRRALDVKDRDPDKGAACLLILDNVSDPALLAEPQLAQIPRKDWLRVIATTREGPDKFPVSRQKSLAFIAVDALTEDDAARLLEDHQIATDGQWPAATAAADAAAAREIARELGGFTLAVESVAIYLGLHPDIRPAGYLARLRAEGLPGVDALPADASVAAQMQHREKQLRLVLDQTLARLTPAERTALDYAALLPPDSIPWPWLRALVESEHLGELASRHGYPDPWVAVRRRIEGLRFLQPADRHEIDIGRMHRLVAEHFRHRLQGMRLCQRIDTLHDHISIKPPECPDDRIEALVIIECVTHLSRIGKCSKAAKLLRQRLLSVENHFCGTKQFALFVQIIAASDLMISDARLADEDRAFMLQQRGYCARALGRTEVARESLRQCLMLLESKPGDLKTDHEAKSVVAGLLATTELYAGNLQDAELFASRAVQFGQASGNKCKYMYAECTFGKVRLQRGDMDAASQSFAKAMLLLEEIDSDRQAGREVPPLEPGNVSNAQFRYGEFLLEQNEYLRALEIADLGLTRLAQGRREPMSAGLLEVIKGWAMIKVDTGRERGSEIDILTLQALNHLKEGRLDTETIRGHLLRAEYLAHYSGDMNAMKRQLDDAYDMATRGGFLLHLVDVLLARVLHFAFQNPYPWHPEATPLLDLEQAGKLVASCGYWRRKQQLDDACKRLS